MTKRIFSSIFWMVLAAVLTGLALVFGILYGNFQNRLGDELKNQAEILSGGVEREGEDYLKNLSGMANRVTWVNADGDVLFDTDADASTLGNHADREEIKQAMQEGSGRCTRYSSTIAETTMYYAILLSDGSVLRVSAVQRSVWALLLNMLPSVLLVTAVILIAAAIAAKGLSHRITRPINGIDVEDPTQSGVYEELSPLIRKLTYQRSIIDSQMELLKTKQREFSDITENMQEGFIVIDKATNVLSYNSAALGIFGADSEPFGSVFAMCRVEEFRDAVQRALKGEHAMAQLRVRDRCYQLTANPAMDSGETLGAIIVVVDVTEKEERENLRREFTANVSHELKTPLTAISGTAEVLKNGLVKSEDVPHFAGNIYAEAQRLIVLIEDILRLSRLDEGAGEQKLQSVDIARLCSEIAKRLSAEAAKRNISISVEGGGVELTCDRSVIDELIYNLADNAVKYNKEGGSVLINVKSEPAEVVVEDTGIGIPAEMRERVFERFYRVDKSHSKRIGGTGLGLSIVKHAAAFLGAQVSLESKEGEGTRVTVAF